MLSSCFSGTSAAAASVGRSCASRCEVNVHFRCRAWQARILDADRCDLLREDSSDVYKAVRHENTDLWTCSVLVALVVYCVRPNECARCLLRPFSNFCRKEGSRTRAMPVAMQSGLPIYHLLGTTAKLRGVILNIKLFFTA